MEIGFPWLLSDKDSTCNAGDIEDVGPLPGLGRSPGKGSGNPLGILAWRIPWTKEPGGLQFMGSQRVRHNWATNTFTFILSVQFSSIAQLYLTLQPHGLQHARPSYPSPTAGVYSNSWPLSRWCHPTISSSVILFSCLQSFPATATFQMS